MNTTELIRPPAARRRAVAAAVFGALTAAILGPPYLLIRHLRSVRARRASSRDRATLLAPVRSTQVAS